jgi:hypothetical protein
MAAQWPAANVQPSRGALKLSLCVLSFGWPSVGERASRGAAAADALDVAFVALSHQPGRSLRSAAIPMSA